MLPFCNRVFAFPLVISSIFLHLFLCLNITMTPPMTGQGMDRKPSSESVSSSVSRLMHLDHHPHNNGGINNSTSNKSSCHPSNGDTTRRTSDGRIDNTSVRQVPYPIGPSSSLGQSDDYPLRQGNRSNAYPHLSQSQHPLDNSTPVVTAGVTGLHLSTPTNTSTPRRKNNSKDGIESGLRAFFRSSSRPPSPDLADAHAHSGTHTNASPSHTRKTSFGSNRNPSFAGSVGSLLSNSGGSQTNSSGNQLSSTSSSSNQLQQIRGHNQQYQPSQHSFSPDMGRRRSAESYSRSPSPDPSGTSLQQQPQSMPHQYQVQGQTRQQVQGYNQQYQQQTGQSSSIARRYVFPNTPPSQPRSHQRTNSIMSNKTPVSHRRTKSTDFGEMFTKRPTLQEPEHHASHVASPAKEAKKIILGLFKKKNSGSSSNIGSSSNSLSHQTSQHTDGKIRFARPVLNRDSF